MLSLATSGGVTEAGPAVHPYFFTGFLAEPGPAAQALIATAAVARAQYHVAAATIRMLRDPLVTSNTDRLRFESFSTCCGVHARLDLPPCALSTLPVTSGTTNVDFNPPMRAALAGAVATAGQILLKVGDEEVTAVTEACRVTERKVDLPARWVKGFGEVSALHASMRPVAELAGPDVQRFISGLPWPAVGPSIAIHRSLMQEALLEAALVPVRMGVRLTGIVADGTTVQVRFDDGGTARYDLVVGADGAGSSVRGLLWPDAAAGYAGESWWRGVVPARRAWMTGR